MAGVEIVTVGSVVSVPQTSVIVSCGYCRNNVADMVEVHITIAGAILRADSSAFTVSGSHLSSDFTASARALGPVSPFSPANTGRNSLALGFKAVGTIDFVLADGVPGFRAPQSAMFLIFVA